MAIAAKLQVKEGQKVRVVGKPKDVDLGDVPATTSAKAEAVLVFAKDKKEMDARLDALMEAAKADRLAWLAYPKAGQLGTDLNRDIVWKLLDGTGIKPVRQVSLDDVWSALRFRPA